MNRQCSAAAFEVRTTYTTAPDATRPAQIVSAIPYFSTISSLLTLFSKFFSSFLHSTCSLSVSHKYLALEEVYLPFKAEIPNNPTLRNPSSSLHLRQVREFHPLCFPVPWAYARRNPSEKSSRLQFGSRRDCRF